MKTKKLILIIGVLFVVGMLCGYYQITTVCKEETSIVVVTEHANYYLEPEAIKATRKPISNIMKLTFKDVPEKIQISYTEFSYDTAKGKIKIVSESDIESILDEYNFNYTTIYN